MIVGTDSVVTFLEDGAVVVTSVGLDAVVVIELGD